MSEILGRVPVASGLSLCALRAAGRLRASAPEVVAMHGVRTADLPDGGLGPASDAAATDSMVLGRLPRDHSSPRAVGRAAATPARAQRRDGLALLHKLRLAMGNPEREPLQDKAEVDETYLGGPEVGLQGGRQLREKALSVGAVDVRGKAAGRVRLQVVPDASARSLTGFVQRTVAPGPLILTDGWGAYAPLSNMGDRHRPRTQGTPERAATLLPHIHRVFGKLKTWLRAPTTASGTITSRPTWTSSPFVSTGGAPRWRPSKPCSALPRAPTDPRPTRCCPLRSQPDRQKRD